MQVPAAEQIYVGASSLKRMPELIRQDQIKELNEALPTLENIYGMTKTFQEGYELGLAVARVIIASSAEVLTKGGDPFKIL